MSWSYHIDSVHRKASIGVGMMIKLRQFLPLKSVFTLYNALVLPHFNYGSLVWGGAGFCYLNRLLTLQKKAIRLCCNADHRSHSPPLFKQLYSLNLSDNIRLKTALFVFEALNGRLPPCFTGSFICNTRGHMQTRQRDDIKIPFCRLTLTQSNSIKYKGTKLWNSLDVGIKLAKSPRHFKTVYKSYLLHLYNNA